MFAASCANVDAMKYASRSLTTDMTFALRLVSMNGLASKYFQCNDRVCNAAKAQLISTQRKQAESQFDWIVAPSVLAACQRRVVRGKRKHRCRKNRNPCLRLGRRAKRSTDVEELYDAVCCGYYYYDDYGGLYFDYSDYGRGYDAYDDDYYDDCIAYYDALIDDIDYDDYYAEWCEALLASEARYKCECCQQTWWRDCCNCLSLDLDLYAKDTRHVDQRARGFYHERRRKKRCLRCEGELGSRSGRCRPPRTRTRKHRKPKNVVSISKYRSRNALALSLSLNAEPKFHRSVRHMGVYSKPLANCRV